MAQRASAIIQEEPLEIAKDRRTLRLLIVAMRPYQWVKNLFVLAPLLFGRKLGDPGALADVALAFCCFCAMSSSLYILNDIIDAATDRAHPEKKSRPIASGALPFRISLPGAAFLLIGSLFIANTVNRPFLLVAVAYWVLMLGYSFILKHAIVLDAMIIAAGFVLRVVGGAIAVGVAPTHWLVVCAFLLALYLAFAKRRQELLLLSEEALQHRRVLCEYTIPYLEQVNTILIGATAVCYALYTIAPETVARFGTDKLIYGTGFVIYGLLRYLALIQKPANGGNPSRLLMRDKPLLIAIAGWTLYNTLVIYHEFVLSLLRS
jgi:4-hydroxybenzoate polyprenyltransferase